MVDVMRMPQHSFGYVPTPALVVPIEFTMRRVDYEQLGGHVADIRSVEDVLRSGGEYGAKHQRIGSDGANPWPNKPTVR